MKDTLNFLEIFKSKTFWVVVGLELLALEPYLPQISQMLPEQFAAVGAVILPALILGAKVARDNGVLNLGKTASKSRKGVIKDVAKTKAKEVATKRVTERAEKVIKKIEKL